MPKIKVNDINMYYEIHGNGEPLVFISGFSADHTAWRTVINDFKNQYQVIIFDNRGAGQTDAPEGPYSIEQMAEDVVALCQHLNIAQAHFVGNSMGGYILQMLAYRHAHLVKSATICNSTVLTQTCFHFFVEAQLELIKSNAPPTAVIKASCAWVFSFQFLMQEGILPGLIALGLSNPYPFTVTGYQGQFAALKGFDSRSWISEVTVPTLVIGSDQDLIFSEASIKLLADGIPKAQYHSFKHCGHLPHIEYPRQFEQRVKEFLLAL